MWVFLFSVCSFGFVPKYLQISLHITSFHLSFEFFTHTSILPSPSHVVEFKEFQVPVQLNYPHRISSLCTAKMSTRLEISPDTFCLDFGNKHARFKVLVLLSVNGLQLSGMRAINELIQEGFFERLDRYVFVLVSILHIFCKNSRIVLQTPPTWRARTCSL